MAEKDHPHAAHIPEETFLRMKWHFPAWATSHRDPYLSDRKHRVYTSSQEESQELFFPLASQ